MQVFLRGGQMAVLDTMRTDIMHTAAVNIQRHARGLLIRRKVHRIRRAIVKIQVSLTVSCKNKSKLSGGISLHRQMLAARLPSKSHVSRG